MWTLRQVAGTDCSFPSTPRCPKKSGKAVSTGRCRPLYRLVEGTRVRKMNGQIPPSQGQSERGRGGGNQPAVFPRAWAGAHVQNPGRAAASAPPMPSHSADQYGRLRPLSSLQPAVAAAAAAAAVTAASSSQFEQPPPTPAVAAPAVAATATPSGRSNGAGAAGVGGVAGGQVEVIEVCMSRLFVYVCGVLGESFFAWSRKTSTTGLLHISCVGSKSRSGWTKVKSAALATPENPVVFSRVQAAERTLCQFFPGCGH